MSIEDWLVGFQRDLTPEREVLVWERMGRAYTAYTATRDLNHEARKEVFKLLLCRDAEAIEALQHLSIDDATEVFHELEVAAAAV